MLTRITVSSESTGGDAMGSTTAPADPRDVRGAYGGSRLFEQPAHAAELERFRTALAVPGPVLVEIGFDFGRRLLATARANPTWTVVGLEIRRRRVEAAAERAGHHGLARALPWRADARAVFARFAPQARFDVVEALFPDPWWNAAHRRRRLLVDRPFLDDVCRALRPGGLLHIATDVRRYADHVGELLRAHPGLILDPDADALRPTCPAQSRREWQCEKLGRPIYRFYARRIDDGAR